MRPLTCWDCGFNSRQGHGYLSLRECHVLSGTDLCVGPITRTEESYEVFFFLSNATTCPFSGLRGPPSWSWQECNRLLRLGRPRGAVTLSRWCVSGDRGGCSARRGLNLNSTNLPRPWSPRESCPSRKIPTVGPGIEPGTSRLVVRDSDH